MGRIQVIESEKDVKMLPGGTVYARPFVERCLKVANKEEGVWEETRAKVRKMLAAHYQDVEQAFSLISPFKEVIEGSLALRVKEAFRLGLPEGSFDKFIAEARKLLSLSAQLPLTLLFPLFEVDLRTLRNELELRLNTILEYIFIRFESTLIFNSSQICLRYTEIVKTLN
jgi:hypothetical protein